MRADLMGAPGHKLDLQQGQPSADGQRFIPGDDLLRAARRRVGDAHNAALGVLQKVVAQQGSGRVRAAKRHAEVALFNVARLNGGSQKRLRRTVLRQQHQPACTGVQPVAEHSVGSLALSGQLRLYAAKQRVTVRAVHSDACRFAGNDDVVVLIHKHGGGGGAVLQLVVVQEQLDNIAVLHAGGERLLLAVQLDLVLAQGLVQPPHAQSGELVHQVLVQPHGQQAFYMQFFHFVVNS